MTTLTPEDRARLRDLAHRMLETPVRGAASTALAEGVTALLDALVEAERAVADVQLAQAVAAVTPCSCSAQRARADRAEAERDQARGFAELWKECARGHVEGERFAVGHINAWRKTRNAWRARARSAEAAVQRVRVQVQGWVDEYGDPVYQGNGWAEGVADAARAIIATMDGDA